MKPWLWAKPCVQKTMLRIYQKVPRLALTSSFTFFISFFLQISVHHGVFTPADVTFKWKVFSFTNFLAEFVAISTLTKVIHTKYSKHWPYTVAHTIMCAENVKSWFKSWVFPFTFQAYILHHTLNCMCVSLFKFHIWILEQF